MSETAIKEKPLYLFVPSDLDDYGLDPYEFRIYARISRRAGKDGELRESIPNMARSCHISESRVRQALLLLQSAGLIASTERPGNTTLHRLTPQSQWVPPDRLQELRKVCTPIKNNRSSKNSTPTKSDSTPLPKLTPLPLSNLTDEGISSKGIPNKVNPPPLTPQHELTEEGVGLNEQLTQLVQSTLVPIFSSLVEEAKRLLAEVVQSASPRVSRSKVRNKDLTKITDYPSLPSTRVLEELALLVGESVESLQTNPNLCAALEQYPNNIEDALLYFKQASSTWKNKPGLGLFISAIKKALKPTPTKPGGGWKEWADEAKRRRLMEYSQSHNGDIMVHFVSGIQRLWSEVRSLSWIEIETIARNGSEMKVA